MIMILSNLLIIFTFSFMALFPVINPLGNGFVVNDFLNELNDHQHKTAIQKLIINYILIGIGTLVIRHLFLLIFGLAIPVIQLGGGLLICKTAMELLSNSGTPNKSDKKYIIKKMNHETIFYILITFISHTYSRTDSKNFHLSI